MIRAVLLDVGGTLWPDRWPEPAPEADPRLADLCAAVPGLSRDLGADLIQRLGDRAAGMESALTQDTAGLVREAAASLGLTLDGAGIVAIRRAMCLPAAGRGGLFSGARALLATIKAEDLRCVIVSNAVWRDGEAYRRDFEALGVSDFIDAIISSVDVGFRKPHPAIFRVALEAAACPATQCVMIGNSESKDVQPALDLGMRVIRVAIEEPRPAVSAAHTVVTSLADATDLVRCWAWPGRAG
jgi:FMN phosphatase YigB (HAD superfamily)